MVNLTQDPTTVTLEPALLLYLEKTGPFAINAPLAWQEFIPLVKAHIDMGNIIVGVGLSHIDSSKKGNDAFVYQAGMLLRTSPATVPEGLQLRTLAKGKYASFLLTGSYMQLPQAYPAAFEILAKKGYSTRDDFCIEKYLTNAETTPEAELKTEILIPIV
ncbi:MAG TPA: GyrI-like domain-containing protein [Rickettsiales bacterium]|nr:GyrI-like domain-containing protein [Rickettsiales bacterium]